MHTIQTLPNVIQFIAISPGFYWLKLFCFSSDYEKNKVHWPTLRSKVHQMDNLILLGFNKGIINDDKIVKETVYKWMSKVKNALDLWLWYEDICW